MISRDKYLLQGKKNNKGKSRMGHRLWNAFQYQEHVDCKNESMSEYV